MWVWVEVGVDVCECEGVCGQKTTLSRTCTDIIYARENIMSVPIHVHVGLYMGLHSFANLSPPLCIRLICRLMLQPLGLTPDSIVATIN